MMMPIVIMRGIFEVDDAITVLGILPRPLNSMLQYRPRITRPSLQGHPGNQTDPAIYRNGHMSQSQNFLYVEFIGIMQDPC